MFLWQYRCRLCGVTEGNRIRRRLLHSAGKHVVPVLTQLLQENIVVPEDLSLVDFLGDEGESYIHRTCLADLEHLQALQSKLDCKTSHCFYLEKHLQCRTS